MRQWFSQAVNNLVIEGYKPDFKLATEYLIPNKVYIYFNLFGSGMKYKIQCKSTGANIFKPYDGCTMLRNT